MDIILIVRCSTFAITVSSSGHFHSFYISPSGSILDIEAVNYQVVCYFMHNRLIFCKLRTFNNKHTAGSIYHPHLHSLFIIDTVIASIRCLFS